MFQANSAIEEVVVEAPVVRRKVAATSPTGYTTVMIQLGREVTFADLDLTEESDVEKLEARIETTAKEACQALDDMLDRTSRTRRTYSVAPGRRSRTPKRKSRLSSRLQNKVAG